MTRTCTECGEPIEREPWHMYKRRGARPEHYHTRHSETPYARACDEAAHDAFRESPGLLEFIRPLAWGGAESGGVTTTHG